MSQMIEISTFQGQTSGLFTGAVAKAVAAIAKTMRHRKAVHQLRQLDDHILHDIGLVRSEIVLAARYGRGDSSDY